MIAMGRRGIALAGLIGATVCFSLGWLTSRAVEPSKREPMATPSSEPVRAHAEDAEDAGAEALLFLIDPSTVVLLPDASLTIDPPAPPLVPGQSNGRRD
jgi:hypothetical protein